MGDIEGIRQWCAYAAGDPDTGSNGMTTSLIPVMGFRFEVSQHMNSSGVVSAKKLFIISGNQKRRINDELIK